MRRLTDNEELDFMLVAHMNRQEHDTVTYAASILSARGQHEALLHTALAQVLRQLDAEYEELYANFCRERQALPSLDL